MLALHYDPDPRSPRLWMEEAARPELHAGEVRVEAAASAINRADLLQVRGLYPVPPGESEIPGLECAGTILEVGEGVEKWRVGQRVMALLAGGGHAEEVAVPAGQLMPLPERLSFEEGAALPEVALTAWTNLAHEGEMRPGETVLITAAASGVGSFAVQLAFELGARVFVAGRKRERLEELRRFGADVCLPLGEEMPEAVRRANGDRGVDLVIDLVGGEGFRHALAALRDRGRLVLVGILDGQDASVDLAEILRRRLVVRGSVLRSRSRHEKADLVSSFHKIAGPRIADGRLRPVVDRVLPFEDLPEAYRVLKEEEVLGKVVVSRGKRLKGERAKRRKGEKGKGRKGERAKGRKGERERVESAPISSSCAGSGLRARGRGRPRWCSRRAPRTIRGSTSWIGHRSPNPPPVLLPFRPFALSPSCPTPSPESRPPCSS